MGRKLDPTAKCPECGGTGITAKAYSKGKSAKKVWICVDCLHEWPRQSTEGE